MDEQTRKLLEECSIGCKMAIDSMDQVQEYIRDTELKQLVDKYTERHKQLENDAAARLEEAGNRAKSPGAMASAFSWFTTEVKLTVNDDNSQIAKLLIDGCSMGIKTLGERANTLNRADAKAAALAQKVIKTEEDFMKELKKFL